jgi:hypothetical protein
MGLDKFKRDKIKKALLNKPYVFYFVFIFLFYIFLNVLVNQIHVTFYTLTHSRNFLFMIPYFLFNFLIVPGLVGLTVNLSIIRFKQLKELKNSKSSGDSVLGAVGVFGGILGGACPACIGGFLPAILGLIGVGGFSLSALPLDGLEIQILSSALLIWAILLLSKEPVCKVKVKND